MVIGLKDFFDPLSFFSFAEADIGRDLKSIADFRKCARVAGVPVGVNNESGIARQHRRRVEPDR